MASPSNSYIPEIENSPSITSEGKTLPFSEVIKTSAIKSSSNSFNQEKSLEDISFSKAYIFKNKLFTRLNLPLIEGEELIMKISYIRYISIFILFY